MRIRAVGAAVAAELILEHRAHVRRKLFLGFGTKRLVLMDPSPTGNEILDVAIEWTAGRRRPPLLPRAVGEFTDLAHGRCRQSLLRRGLVDAEAGLQVNDAAKRIAARVESVLVAGEAPDPRSLALASLVHGSRFTRRVVRPGVEYVAVRNAKRLPKHHREMAGFAVDTQDLAEELHGLITDIGDAAGAIVGGDAGGDGGGGDGGSI
jgi:hypothetical protein